MINLEQIRAHRAFEKATAVAEQNYHEEFLSLAQNLPAMFQNNGLLATWAFLLSKKGEGAKGAAQQEILETLLTHFRDSQFDLGVANSDVVRVFVEEWTVGATSLDGIKLMKLTAEAVAFSGWLKRAAESLCDK